MWSIGTEMEKQSLDVNNRNCKMEKLRNKIPHFKVTRMRYADDKFTHTRLISGCQWMGNDTQEWLSPIYDGTGKGVSLKGEKTFLALHSGSKRLT
jgi:hypothetical protein